MAGWNTNKWHAWILAVCLNLSCLLSGFRNGIRCNSWTRLGRLCLEINQGRMRQIVDLMLPLAWRDTDTYWPVVQVLWSSALRWLDQMKWAPTNPMVGYTKCMSEPAILSFRSERVIWNSWQKKSVILYKCRVNSDCFSNTLFSFIFTNYILHQKYLPVGTKQLSQWNTVEFNSTRNMQAKNKNKTKLMAICVISKLETNLHQQVKILLVALM
jgi:hypothetical protein